MTAFRTAPPSGPSADDRCVPSLGLNRGVIDAERLAGIAKALGEPLRVEIMDVLRRSEQSVCQCELIAMFGIRQSLLAHHMHRLVDAGLVQAERRHRWVYYSPVPDAAGELLSWLS